MAVLLCAIDIPIARSFAVSAGGEIHWRPLAVVPHGQTFIEDEARSEKMAVRELLAVFDDAAFKLANVRESLLG